MVATTSISSNQEPEFGYGQLFGVLLRRWPWIAGALGVAMAGAVYVSMQEEPTYRSTMQLIVEPNFHQDLQQRDLVGVSDDSISQRDYATQLALMRSSQFIVDAVELLKPEYPDLEPGAVESALSLYQVAEGRDATRIFEATFVGADPLKTQKLLEALKTVYLQYNEDQQAERLIRGLEHVNNQLARTRNNLESAQDQLEQFRQNQNLIDPTLQGQSVVEALNRVQAEQRSLLADLNQVEQQYQVLQQQLDLSPETALVASRLSQSPRIQSLLNSLQETSLALADRQIIFTEQDPSVQVLIEQKGNQLAQLRQEVSTIMRQPESNLDAATMSYLQLGSVDLNLVAQLLEVDASLASLDARWQTLNELESLLRGEINRYPSLIAEYDRLQPVVEIERNTLEQLLQEREQLSSELARGGFVWEVVEPPQFGEQIGPDPVRPLALGVVAGLFIGGALAFARESMDKRLRTSDDLKRQVPLPLLGILPMQTQRRGFGLPALRREQEAIGLHPELADSELMQTVLWPQFRDSLDLIANNLQLLPGSQTPKAITITSGLPEEGKTTLTLGLAMSLARMNQRVLVIDADLRRSGIQTGLGMDMEIGLSTLLSGQSGNSRPHRIDFGPIYLDVLPAGPFPADPIALLSSPKFSRLIQRCKEHYDLVLVDTPPVLGTADALKVGAVCDGTVLVSRLDRITQPELMEVISILSPIQVLGIIANGAKSVPNRYGSYSNQAYASQLTDA